MVKLPKKRVAPALVGEGGQQSGNQTAKKTNRREERDPALHVFTGIAAWNMRQSPCWKE